MLVCYGSRCFLLLFCACTCQLRLRHLLSLLQGEDNVPSNVVLSLREVARIKGLDEAEVARLTTENARKLFPRLAATIS